MERFDDNRFRCQVRVQGPKRTMSFHPTPRTSVDMGKERERPAQKRTPYPWLMVDPCPVLLLRTSGHLYYPFVDLLAHQNRHRSPPVVCQNNQFLFLVSTTSETPGPKTGRVGGSVLSLRHCRRLPSPGEGSGLVTQSRTEKSSRLVLGKGEKEGGETLKGPWMSYFPPYLSPKSFPCTE